MITPTRNTTPSTTPTPRLPRLVVALGPGVVSLAAAVASFKFTAEFGRNNAWPGASSYLLPLTVDGLALTAWWKAATYGGRLAWACGWGTTAVSIAANAAGHAGVQGEAWTIVAGGWPALCLALIVHLLWFPPKPAEPVWAEVADPTPSATPAAPAADAADSATTGATPGTALRGACESAAPVVAEAGPAVVECAGTALDAAAVTTEAPWAWHPVSRPAPRNVLAAFTVPQALAYAALADPPAATVRPLTDLGFTDKRARELARLAKPRPINGHPVNA